MRHRGHPTDPQRGTARQSAALTRYTEHVHDTRDGQRAARDAGGEPAPVGEPTPVQEAAAALAPILRIAPRTMATRIHTAHTLTDLPRTAAMGWAGDLEPYRASVITQAARQVGHEQLSEFEARLHHGDITELPGSRVKTRAGLIASRLAPAPDPDDPDQDAPASDADRGVRVGAGEQAGLTKWDALLPTDSSCRCALPSTPWPPNTAQDNPQLSVGQSRADALVDLVLSDVQVTTTATLIIPTTDAPASEPAPSAQPDPAAEPEPASTAPSSQATVPGQTTRPRGMGPAPRRHPRPRSRPALRTGDQSARRATPIPSRPVIGRGAPGG